MIAGAASKLCQAGHAKADKPLFTSLAKRCATKYAGNSGTMYQCAAAFCELDIARVLASLNAKPD